MRRFLLILACLLSLGGYAEARTFWVSINGNDSNGCTNSASPLTTTANRTITGSSGGLACLTQSGDVLMVAPGTYTAGEIMWSTGGTGSNGVPARPIANGTASAYTKVLGSDPNNPAVFQPGGNTGGELTGGGIRFDRSSGDSYIEVSNLIIDGTTQDGLSTNIGRGVLFLDNAHHIRMNNIKVRDFRETNPNVPKANGLMLYSGAHHIHISNCEIYNNGNTVMRRAHNIYWAGDDSILEDCYVHDPVGDFNAQFYASTTEGPTEWYTSDRNVIRRNIFKFGATSAPGHNVVIEGSDQQFYENIIIGKSNAGSDCLRLGFGPISNRILVYNNVIYDCQSEGIQVGNSVGTSLKNSLIMNNLIVGAGGAPITVNDTKTSGTTIKYNTYFGNGNSNVVSISGATGTVQSNNAVEDPDFTNAAGDDFTLQGGSPSIDDGNRNICTGADVSLGKCLVVITVPFAGTNRDRGRWESGAVSLGPLVTRHLLNNNVNDAENGFTGTASNVTYETATPTPAEGTHSALFNGTTSYVTVPTTGLSVDTGSRCVSYYANALSSVQAIVQQRTANPVANRFGLYSNGTALRGELGGNGALTTTRILSAGEWNRTCFIYTGTGGSGSWRIVDRNPSTHALSEVGSGTYTSLSTLPSTWVIGNFEVGSTSGWDGNIDAVTTYNTALTDAEILSDCEDVFGVGQCTAIAPPTFVAPDFTTAANDTTGLIVTANLNATPVDPSLCLVAANFVIRYPTTAPLGKAWSNCQVSGSVVTFTMTGPPDGTEVPALDNYIKDGDVSDVDETTALTDNYNPPATGADIAQEAGACRHDGTDDSQIWESTCDMPAGGSREFRFPVKNNAGATSSSKAYAVYCSRSNPVVALTRVTDDCTGALGICYKPLAIGQNGIPDAADVIDHEDIGTGTFQSGGVVRRMESTTAAVEIEASKHVEFSYMLQKATGLALGDSHSCEVLDNNGEPLDSTVPLVSNTVRPRAYRR